MDEDPSCQNCGMDFCMTVTVFLRGATDEEKKMFEKGETVCPMWFGYDERGVVRRITDE